MQDAARSSALLKRDSFDSNFAEDDHGIESKSTSPTTGKRRAVSRTPAFRVDPTLNAQTIYSNNKKHDYAPSVSDRESGRRVSMNNNSNIGADDVALNAFVKENLPRTTTHGVKNDGRRRDSLPLDVKDKESLTDAELVEYFADRMRRLPLTYGFKSFDRYSILQKAMSINYDKDIDVASGLRKTQSHETVNVPDESTRHSFFKSRTARKIFLPKLGPAPGDYEHQTTMNGPIITSSFRSGTKRFSKKLVKIPGPGTYDKVIGIPTPKQIDTYLSRGIYFRSSFT